MLTFDEAKLLKKGDVVYGEGYTGYVVSVAIKEAEEKAFVTFTDGGAGGDEFTLPTGDPRLSLTRQVKK